MSKKHRRATCIVEISNLEGERSILIAEQHDYHYYLLPGGLAHHSEQRIQAAIRELKEETSLNTESVSYLFDFQSKHYHHKVFFIELPSKHKDPKPQDDVKVLHYLPVTHLNQLDLPIEQQGELVAKLSNSTKQVLKKYHQHLQNLN